MLGNNKIRLTLTKNLENQNYIKYINMMHHYMKRLIKNRELKIE